MGTRGHALLDGARALKIHGRYVPVRAQIVDMPYFSVHADADELLEWLASAPARPDACFVVHGEPAAAATMHRRIEAELNWVAAIPRYGEKVRLT